MKIHYMLFLLSFTAIVILCSAASCPEFQRLQTIDGQSVCCKPVFNCPFDTQVKFCTVNGSQDTCEQCPIGTRNRLISSSLETYNCFTVTRLHNNCPLDDTEFMYENLYCPEFPCRCRWEQCYFGESCSGPCTLSINSCGINEEMNKKTGVCEPCKQYMYKNETGCQPCLWNETELRLSYVTQVINSTGTMTQHKLVMESASTAFHNNVTIPLVVITVPSLTTIHIKDQQNGNFVPIVIGIVAGVVLLSFIIALCVMLRRKWTNICNRHNHILREFGNDEKAKTTLTKDHLTDGHTDTACNGNEDTLVKEIDVNRPLIPAHKKTSKVKPTVRDPPQQSIAFCDMSLVQSTPNIQDDSHQGDDQGCGVEQTQQKHA